MAVVADYGARAASDVAHDRDYGHVAATLCSVASVYWLMAPVYWLMAPAYWPMAAFYGLMKKHDWPSPAALAVPSGAWQSRIP